jgi:hypothetical protein
LKFSASSLESFGMDASSQGIQFFSDNLCI